METICAPSFGKKHLHGPPRKKIRIDIDQDIFTYMPQVY